MSTLTLTLLFAFALIFLSLMGLALSWLITGKWNYKLGMCGKDPNQKTEKDGSCGKDKSCSLCRGDTPEKK
jgi:hypothetical protein